MKTRISLAISLFVLALAAAASAQGAGKATPQLGTVELSNSCGPAVQGRS